MRRFATAWIFIPVLLSACGRSPYQDRSLPIHPPAADDPATLSAGGASVGLDLPVITGPVTLRRALALALRHHPALAGAAWEMRVREAEALQAGLLPNPELEFEIEDIGAKEVNVSRNANRTAALAVGAEWEEEAISSTDRTAFHAATYALSLAQTVELAGQRHLRRHLAELGTRLAGWDYEAARLTVCVDTVLAFVELLAAQERVDLTASAMAQASSLLEAAQQRRAAGRTVDLDVLRARTRVAAATADFRTSELARDAARQALAATWGGTGPVTFEAQGGFETLPVLPPLAVLVDLVERIPEVARWATEMEVHLATLRLERRSRIPDLELRVGLEHSRAEDATTYGIGVGFALPVFDRNQGGILAARRRIEQARSLRRDAEVRVYAAVLAAWYELAAARVRTELLAGPALTAAIAAVAAAEEAWKSGKLSQMEVLEAQETLLELKTDLLESRAEAHAVAAHLEGLLGTPLSAIAGQTAGPEASSDRPTDSDPAADCITTTKDD